MPDGLNKVMIIGNLGQDPEMRYTANGSAVTTFSVAVNRSYSADGERREETEWFRVVAWSKLAPGHDPEPLRLFPAFAIDVESPADGDAEGSHGAAVGGIAHLRVGAEVADDHDLIEAVRHRRSPLRPLVRGR